MLVAAKELEGGEWFRKRTGQHRYLVISESSARFYKLPEGQIHGVSLETGNMTSVAPDTQVVRVSFPAPKSTSTQEAVLSWPQYGQILGCGLCEGCEGGGDCDHAGEPSAALESLDDRF